MTDSGRPEGFFSHKTHKKKTKGTKEIRDSFCAFLWLKTLQDSCPSSNLVLFEEL
jgi:hypothetical protein